MGGYAAALAASIVPEAFSKLLLIDPVVLPETAYQRGPGGDHFARKRKNRWTSADEMFERFRGRSPFNAWDEWVLRDYCDHALQPAPDGKGWVLACPPEFEASIYEQSHQPASNIHADIARVDVPVVVLRSARPFRRNDGSMDMLGSPTEPALASKFANGRDVIVPYSHFIPMEAPAFVAGQIGMLIGGP